MAKVSVSTLSDELSRLRKEPDASGLKRFFTSLLSMDQARRERVIDEAIRGAERCVNEDRAFYWMVELDREYPGDIGVLSPLIFNLMELGPGEAIYIPAGELHAYLRGVGMELMANSDNVLRGGLTPKHVDVPELLKIVNFISEPVLKVKPHPGELPGEKIYASPAEEFQLSVISVANGDFFISERDRGVEIMICMVGRKTRIKDLESGDPALITDSVTIYFRDIYDHTIQIIETIETCRDLVSGMHDMYLSAISNKMNEIMKVLTIIATIFIPLTFIAGIYGMNFAHMPELQWRWSYPVLWCVLILVGAVMLVFFRKKKWL